MRHHTMALAFLFTAAAVGADPGCIDGWYDPIAGVRDRFLQGPPDTTRALDPLRFDIRLPAEADPASSGWPR